MHVFYVDFLLAEDITVYPCIELHIPLSIIDLIDAVKTEQKHYFAVSIRAGLH